jgi:kynurenine 3-monooxygenase
MAKQITIVGAGPVGCLLAIYLIRRGSNVTIVDKRPDPRTSAAEAGRSINLALSNRGLRPLEELGIADTLKAISIPMRGRMMHDLDSRTSFLAYGKQGQYINSISRSELNIALINEATRGGATILFRQMVTDVSPEEGVVYLEGGKHFTSDIIIGADGAGSVVRKALSSLGHVTFLEEFIEHGYKELSIPARADGFRFEPNALHIWPRESYMLIALPNPDKSFTCTLFLPLKGKPSFAELGASVPDFFKKVFPDAFAVIPDLQSQWQTNPVAGLGTVKCMPWSRKRVLLVGDAAHAVVPFYGQGMNAGFEDCRILNGLLHKHKDDWSIAIPAFEAERKPDADAIAKLALDNFVEMRDLVADAEFLLQKKIEARLNELFPERWIPLYSMVTFQDKMRYSDALKIGERQKKIMREVMATPSIAATWQSLDFAAIVSKLDSDHSK